MENLDPIDIVGQELRQAEMAQDRRTERNGQIEDFKWLMSDKRGRRFVWRLLEKSGIYRNPFTGNSQTFFNCGQMNMGQWLMAEIHEVCPELYMLMVTEAADDKKMQKV
jgi:hypothetical protein